MGWESLYSVTVHSAGNLQLSLNEPELTRLRSPDVWHRQCSSWTGRVPWDSSSTPTVIN